MATIFDLIVESPTVRDEFKGSPAWHIIEDAMRERINEQGDAPFSTTAEAWEFYNDNRQHAATMDEVGEIERGATLLEIVELFAAVTWRNVAEEEAQTELSALQSLVDYVEGEGFEPDGISESCALGWMSHKSEQDWTLKNGDTACLYTWENVEGEPGERHAVALELDGGRVWLNLYNVID